MQSATVKVSDYIAAFLAKMGIKHVFVISGGASIHLLHSLAKRNDIQPICPHHEQAAAMAADAYARVSGRLGCAIGTSGPGATNMITGIAGAWFDSVPTIFITGQVATYRMKGETGVRQMGFQETETLPMLVPISKYVTQIRDLSLLSYELEKAVHIALSGRPGPVVLDLPDDLQREYIDVARLRHFDPAELPDNPAGVLSPHVMRDAIDLLQKAERPVVILGWGIRLSGAAEGAKALVRRLGIPVLTSWGAKDLIAHDHPLLVGTFGTHGTRAGNFAVQNADLVIAIGARLSTRETGSPMTSWARGARTIIVDIDPAELRKFAHFGKPLDLPICADAKAFVECLYSSLNGYEPRPIDRWFERIRDWQRRYPVGDADTGATETVKPYAFVNALAHILPDDEHIFVDTGCSIAWIMQGFSVRAQRIYHDFNNTAMGWGLPAAIGGSLALGGRAVTCVCGDGGLMMNVQELATIKRHRIPVRIIVVNNGGYSMVQQTQEQWFGGEYFGTSYEGGLAFPEYSALAEAFSIPYLLIDKARHVNSVLEEALAASGPVMVDVHIPRSERVIPQAKFGYPIEDPEPLLPRPEFLSNMIVPPMPKSLEPLP